jgi:nucleoside-diphosphate-sugar epimerase
MRILVTGAGFIGSNVASHLLRAGHHVTLTQRSEKGKIQDRGISYECLEFASNPLKIPEVDAIIHTAACHPNSRIRPSNSDYARTNVMGTIRLAEAAAGYGRIKLIFLSTISVYGEPSDGCLTEGSSIHNPSAYGLSKLMAERALEDYSKELSVLVLRLPGIVGRDAYPNWLMTTLSRLSKGEDVVISNPAALFNNVVHISGLTRLVETALAKEHLDYEVVNVGASEPLTVATVVSKLKELINSKSVIRERPSDRHPFHIDISKVNGLFGKQPTTLSYLERMAADLLNG